jgi:hypothetical protein
MGAGELDARHYGAALILADEMEGVLAQVNALVAITTDGKVREMGHAPCVARNPKAYGQAGQEHGRTISLPDFT